MIVDNSNPGSASHVLPVVSLEYLPAHCGIGASRLARLSIEASRLLTASNNIRLPGLFCFREFDLSAHSSSPLVRSEHRTTGRFADVQNVFAVCRGLG